MAITKRSKAPAKTHTNGARPIPAESLGGTPSSDAIAMRAYELWRESGCSHGDDQAHWFRAEREFRARTTPR